MKFSLEFTERKTVLTAVDSVMAGVSALVALGMWEKWGGLEIGYAYLLSHVEWSLLLLLWGLLAAACGAYEIQVVSSLRATFRAFFLASWLALLIYSVVYFFSPPGSLPRVMALAQVFSLALLVGLWRSAYWLLMHAPGFNLRILIVGAGAAGQHIARVVLGHPNLPYSLIGFVDDDPAKQGQILSGLPVVGVSPDLARLIQAHGVSELVLAISDNVQPELFRALLRCQEAGIRITSMSALYEELTGRVPLEFIGGSNWHVVLPLHHPQTRTIYLLLKRIIDILVASVGLSLLGLFLPLLALAIWMNSPGPIFYRQVRVGKGGRNFQLIKLRTMVSGADQDGMRTAWQDPRVTLTGRFLRLTMLDEAPQFWNVLKGETSLVGPRPEQPELLADLEQQIPFYRLRNSVKPGMAGWALVHQGHIRSTEEAVARLEYDLYYIKHQSLLLDLLIILRTIGRALTLRRGEKVAAGRA